MEAVIGALQRATVVGDATVAMECMLGAGD
jgi:hypothetical protein